MKGIDHISLIHKSLTAQISSYEKEQLQQWINSSPENRNEFFEIKLLWENNSEEETLDTTKFQLQRDRLEDNLTQLIKAEKTKNNVLRGSMAMMIIGLISLMSAIYISFRPLNEKTVRYVVCSGSLLTITLSDSSMVTVNRNTSIVTTQSSSYNRLQINGEAFFMLTKGKRVVIHSDAATIIAKGTSFYVKAIEKKPLEISVLSGEVEVAFKNKVWRLTKNQFLSLNCGVNSITSMADSLNFKKLVHRQTRI